MEYIEDFYIDVNSMMNLENVKNELFDKVILQQNLDLVDSFDSIGELEDYNPVSMNPLLHRLEELEDEISYSFSNSQRELLESNLNESIDVILKFFELTGIRMS